MPTSFQPEKPHDPAKGGMGRSGIAVPIVLALVFLGLLAFVLPAYC